MKNRDLVIGLVLAFACEGAATVKREPTAYSYNGVVLPKLPEWDREVYPYALIGRYTDGSGGYRCAFMKNKLSMVKDESTGEYRLSFGLGVSGTIGYKIDGSEWVSETPRLWWTPIWSNHDIYLDESSGGTLYLSASEPVPVYE